MINYNNGKIYKLEPIGEYDDGDIYIGSTTKKWLCQRMAHHKCLYKKWKLEQNKTKLMSYELFDKYGVDNIKIILLENVNAKSKDELISKESEFIRNTRCINKVIPNRTIKEWCDDNKESIKERSKKHYEDNKSLKIEYQKKYSDDNKDKIKEYKKLYREKNKEKLKEESREYREKAKLNITSK